MAITTLVLLIISVNTVAANDDKFVHFDIHRASLVAALRDFAAQSRLSFALPLDLNPTLETFQPPRVRGYYSVRQALDILLAESGVTYTFVRPDILVFHIEPAQRVTSEVGVPEFILPEVLIKSSRLPGVNLSGPTDDALPHLVLDRDDIERSAATSVVDFLRHEVPAIASNSRSRPDLFTGLSEQLDLRGLGSSQTLILIDGRRIAGRSLGGNSLQPDLLSIPLPAIDRIEMSQGSGSARYGSGATGGVINVVLRHECTRAQAQVDYGDTFSEGSDLRRAFLTDCTSFNEGLTRFRFSGSLSHESPLLAGDRPFVTAGREAILSRNPDFYLEQKTPPLGAQTNIRTVDGSGLWGPGTPAITSVPRGYATADGLLASAGRYSLDLADSAQPDGGARYVLRNGPQTHYLNWTLTHEFSPRLRASLDGALSQSTVAAPVTGTEYAGLSGAFLSANAPNNPFGKDVLVTVPAPSGDGVMKSRLRSQRFAVDAELALNNAWTLRAAYAESEVDLRVQRPMLDNLAAAIATGEIDVLRDLEHEPLDLSPYMHVRSVTPLATTTRTVTVQVGGPLFAIRSGPVLLNGLMEYRYERFAGAAEYVDDPQFATVSSILDPETRSVFTNAVDLFVPLISFSAPSSSPRLELQATGRSDLYATETASPRIADPSSWTSRAGFSASTASIGIRYRPSRNVFLRAAFATGYHPPSASQVAAPTLRMFPAGSFRDPRRGDEPTDSVLLTTGGRLNLGPERSRSWSSGIGFSLPNLKMSLDYIHTLQLDGIFNPAEIALFDLARFESLYPERVLRRDPAEGDSSPGRIRWIDATAINSSRTRVDAWDASVRYEMFMPSVGTVTATARGTWQPSLRMATTPDSLMENQVGVTADFPLKFAATGNVTVARGSWMFGWSTRYLNPYRVSRDAFVVENQGSATVAGQIYDDVFVRYRAGSAALPFEIRVNVQNVFNRRPPFDAGMEGYVSAFGDPRLAMYSLSVAARF